LSAFALIFPPDKPDGKWPLLVHFYIPEENILERVRRDGVNYDVWVRSGLITATPGNVIDYSFIRRDVNKAALKYNLRELAYDPWGAVKLAIELREEDGINMVEHRQGFKSMSPPTKEFYNLVVSRRLVHGNNPVLRWNANNLSVKVDAAENRKPEKDKSTDRIDGIVASIMALGRALENFEKPSIYNKQGLFVI
jgi:phage terminase large subunit-like protein